MHRFFLVVISVLLTNMLNAQFFPSNLYARYQWNELMKSRNRSYGTLNDLPTKCAPNRSAKELWDKGERQLIQKRATPISPNLWNEEMAIFKLCIREDSSFCDAYFRLAQCLAEQTDWVAVLKLLTLAGKKFPLDPMVYMGLGQAFTYLRYPEEALKNFEKLVSILPSSPEGYLGASWVSYQVGEPQKALDYLHQGYEKIGGDTQYLKVFESILLYDTHQTRAAFELLSALQNSAAPSGIYWGGRSVGPLPTGGLAPELKGVGEYYLGLCYAARGEDFYRKAAGHLKVAMKEGVPIDTTLARSIGLLVGAENLKDQLLSTYRVESAPNKKSDRAADEAFENRKIDEATILFSEQIKKDSGVLYPYLRLAECHQIKKEYQKALTTYKLAFKAFPKDDRLVTRLIRQLIRVDSLPTALAMTMDLIAQHPGKKESYYQAALMLRLMNRTSDAIKLLEKWEVKYVGNQASMPWKIPFLLGEFHFLSEDYDRALPYFKVAIRYGSYDPYLNFYYATCLGVSGYLPEAKKYFYDAIDHGAIIDKDAIKKFQLIEKQSTPYGEKY